MLENLTASLSSTISCSISLPDCFSKLADAVSQAQGSYCKKYQKRRNYVAHGSWLNKTSILLFPRVR